MECIPIFHMPLACTERGGMNAAGAHDFVQRLKFLQKFSDFVMRNHMYPLPLELRDPLVSSTQLANAHPLQLLTQTTFFPTHSRDSLFHSDELANDLLRILKPLRAHLNHPATISKQQLRSISRVRQMCVSPAAHANTG